MSCTFFLVAIYTNFEVVHLMIEIAYGLLSLYMNVLGLFSQTKECSILDPGPECTRDSSTHDHGKQADYLVRSSRMTRSP